MSDENKLPAAADAQDTRTRKTVRLRSASAPITQDVPVSDPLASRDTDTGNLEILDDTQTRKTLKLKPMSPGNPAGPKLNLSGAEDTQTRKTVLLRPAAPTQFPGKTAAPQPATVRLDAEEVAAALEDSGSEDQTRAVPRPTAAPGGIKLPGTPAISAVPPKAPAQQPPTVKLETGEVAAAIEENGADDQTRAVPRPTAVPGGIKLPAAPAISAVPPKTAAAPAPQAEVEDQTSAVPRPTAAPGGIKLPAADESAAEAEDQTVKMKRPPRLGPPPLPTAAARPAAESDPKATVKLSAPKTIAVMPTTAAAPKPPTAAAAPQPSTLAAAPKPPTAVSQPSTLAAAPKPPTAVPQPPTAVPQPPTAAPKAPAEAAPEPEKAPAAPKGGDDEISLAPSKRHQEAEEKAEEGEESPKAAAPVRVSGEADAQTPSLFYLILAVATLLFVACAGVITSVHYLYFEQQLDYRHVISVLPEAK